MAGCGVQTLTGTVSGVARIRSFSTWFYPDKNWFVMAELSNRRSSAIRVLLQHSLSSAMALEEKFNQEHTVPDRRIRAVENWVRCIKQALSVCGVYGLCAVDRAEEQVQMCIRQAACLDNYFSWQFRAMARLLGHSLQCYEQALLHQKSGSTNLLTLWLHAGSCTDKVIDLRADAGPVYNYGNRYHRFPSDSLTALDAPVQQKLEGSLESIQTAVSGGEVSSAQWYRRAFEQFSRAAAYVLLDQLFAAYPMVFPHTRETSRMIVQCGNAANEAGDCLKRAASVAAAASKSEYGEHLGALQRLLIEGSQKAAELLSPWEHPPDLGAQRAVGRSVARSAEAMHTLVTRLAPAVAQLEEQRKGVQVSSRAAWLRETEQVLADACRQIAESPMGRCLAEPGQTEPLHRETNRLTALVAAVAERIQGGASKYDKDERAIAEYVARGQAVDRQRSSAHAVMSDCWLQAAMQLRNAVDAAATTSASTSNKEQVLEQGPWGYYGVPPFREDMLRRSAQVYADLATVTFADAASYLMRSKAAPAGQARELWREASDLLVQAGKEHMRVVASVLEKEDIDTDPRQCSSTGQAQESCARRCANAAELMEGMTEVVGSEEAAQRVECRLAMALVRLERAAAVSKQRDTPYSFSRCCQIFSSLLVDAMALVRNQASAPQPLPPYLAHVQPEISPEDAALRQRRIEWLCGVCLVATDLICANSERVSVEGARALESALNCSRAVYTDITGCDPATHAYSHTAEEEEDVEGSTESQQRACDRYLEAVAADLAGRGLECTAWAKAGSVERDARKATAEVPAEAVQYKTVLGDSLARAAWRLRGDGADSDEPVPPHLLAFPEGLPPDFRYGELVDMAVEAEMQHGKQAAAQSRQLKKPVAVNALHKRAMDQFALAAHFAHDQVVWSLLLGSNSGKESAAVATRAMVSGRRFALAAAALEEGKSEVSSLYKSAAELVSTCSTSRSKPNPEVVQRVAEKAAERYAEAAGALAAGDRAAHQRWARSAQATEALLAVGVIKTTKRVTLALAEGYSEERMADADALAAETATATATATNSAAKATSAGKRKASQGIQDEEKGEGASSKQVEQRSKRKRKG